jgi:hypothetical protein
MLITLNGALRAATPSALLIRATHLRKARSLTALSLLASLPF